ncbi:hypothetical protein LXL04_031481 [Taraxacum kok-saghyz]
MQDIHSFESTGVGGGLFAGVGVGGGGDRRLRHHHQDLKCPRCDSSNTKFCYYNNYNLSQPRHFCKSCRRYWTKGGVLRNVPVGGGIRKAKRSNKPKSDTVAAERKSSNSENSSSDSSSLTATTTTRNTTATTTPTDISGSNSTNSTPSMMINFNESSRRFFNIPQSSTLNQSSAGNATSEIGVFSGVMTSSTDQFSGIPSFQLEERNTEQVVENDNGYQIQWKVETTGFMDQTAELNDGGVAGTEDWQDSRDEGLFDLIGNVDQSYWNQNHWNDDGNDHHLNYIP